LWLKIRDERTQVVRLRTRIANLEAAPQPPDIPPAPVAVIGPAPVPAHASSSKAEAATITVTSTANSTTPADKSATAAIKQVLSSPGRVDGMMQMALRQLYPDLDKELGLSQAQTDELISVIARQQAEIATDELGVLSGEVTEPGAAQAIQRKVEDKRHAAEAELSTLLGSKYADWQQYQAKAAARLQVSRLQNTLGTDNALSGEQSKSLLAAFAEAQSQLDTERRNEPEMRGNTREDILGDQIKRLEMTNQRMLDAASPILTSPQQDLYKRMLDQTSGMMRATMRAIAGGSKQDAATH
jgi:hypothetical protein